MRKLYLTGAVLASTFIVTACNNNATTPPATSTANAAAPAAATPAAPAAPVEQASGTATASVNGPAQQDFTIVNNTGHTVMTLAVSASNDNAWGPDILGSDVLANGANASVSFERGQDQCLWDIRATYDDGDSTDMRGVNLCEVATVTLTP